MPRGDLVDPIRVARHADAEAVDVVATVVVLKRRHQRLRRQRNLSHRVDLPVRRTAPHRAFARRDERVEGVGTQALERRERIERALIDRRVLADVTPHAPLLERVVSFVPIPVQVALALHPVPRGETSVHTHEASSIVAVVEDKALVQLTLIREAHRTARLTLNLRNRDQQERHDQRNDRDRHEEFNERESARAGNA